MDARAGLGTGGDRLTGRHLLILVPHSRKEHTRYLMRVFLAAKERWNWRFSMIGDSVDSRPFDKLIKPGGSFHPRASLLRPGAWESDPAVVAATQAQLHEAELAQGYGVGRNILAAAHSIGRAYNVPVIYPKLSRVVSKLLSDSDQASQIYRRLYHFAEDVLDSAQPDFVFVFERVTPYSNVVCAAAGRRGIPSFVFRRSKIRADHGFWTMDPLMLHPESFERARAKRRAGAPVSETAREKISAFRNRPNVIKYIALRWQDKANMNFVRWFGNYARVVVREFINTLRGQDRSVREPNWARLWRYYRGLFLAYYQERYFRALDDEELARMKYVYFPMHKEAELAQTFQAPLWHDQRQTVRVLASTLPFGYRLLVREHRMNYGRRPSRYYRELWDIPNVVVIDAFDSQFKYIANADLVVTENGSTGWEALMMGRRLLRLSSSFYDGADLAQPVVDPNRLNGAILDLLGKPAVVDWEAHDHALGCAIDAEYETTFSMAPEATPDALDHLAKMLRPVLRERAEDQVTAA